MRSIDVAKHAGIRARIDALIGQAKLATSPCLSSP
jgi:hypothetical protein